MTPTARNVPECQRLLVLCVIWLLVAYAPAALAAGVALFTLYTDTPERIPAAMAELDGGWSVGDVAPPVRRLIIDRIT